MATKWVNKSVSISKGAKRRQARRAASKRRSSSGPRPAPTQSPASGITTGPNAYDPYARPQSTDGLTIPGGYKPIPSDFQPTKNVFEPPTSGFKPPKSGGTISQMWEEAKPKSTAEFFDPAVKEGGESLMGMSPGGGTLTNAGFWQMASKFGTKGGYNWLSKGVGNVGKFGKGGIIGKGTLGEGLSKYGNLFEKLGPKPSKMPTNVIGKLGANELLGKGSFGAAFDDALRNAKMDEFRSLMPTTRSKRLMAEVVSSTVSGNYIKSQGWGAMAIIGTAGALWYATFQGMWGQAEAPEPISTTVNKMLTTYAINPTPELKAIIDEAIDAEEEVTNLTKYEQWMINSPLAPIIGIPNKMRGSVIGPDIHRKYTDYLSTIPDPAERAAAERAEEIADWQAHNEWKLEQEAIANQAKIDAWAAARRAASYEERSDAEKLAAMWEDYAERLREAELEQAEAIRNYWLEYKQLVMQMELSRATGREHSNLKFGLL